MADEEKFIKVDTAEGLYDEKATGLACDINSRRVCRKHDWINASLYWERKTDERRWHVSLEYLKKQYPNYEWGSEYGGIRYCKNCKLINCLHNFTEVKVYRIYTDEFYYRKFDIAKCAICG